MHLFWFLHFQNVRWMPVFYLIVNCHLCIWFLLWGTREIQNFDQVETYLSFSLAKIISASMICKTCIYRVLAWVPCYHNLAHSNLINIFMWLGNTQAQHTGDSFRSAFRMSVWVSCVLIPLCFLYCYSYVHVCV